MKKLSLCVLLLWSAAWNLVAGDPKVKEALEKMVKIAQQGPYSVDLKADMNINQMGTTMKMDMSGKMLIADPTHIHSSFDASIEMPKNNPNMPPQMDMAMKQIFDGQTMWMEVNMKQMNMKQVMKMSLDTMKKQAENMGINLPGGGLTDPTTMIQNMDQILDMKVYDEKDGKLFIRADFTEEMSKKVGLPGFGTFFMELDAKNIYPMEFRMMMGDDPFMVMKMTNYQRLAKEDIPADTFSYTPPEGVQVMDLDAMMSGANPNQ